MASQPSGDPPQGKPNPAVEFETREVEALERIANASERIARALEKQVFGSIIGDK